MLRHAPMELMYHSIAYFAIITMIWLFGLTMVKIGIDLGGTKIEIVALDESEKLNVKSKKERQEKREEK